MQVIENKDLVFDTDSYDVILVATSVFGMLTQGFQRKIKLKYPYVDEMNINQPYGDLRRLGTRLTIVQPPNPMISLLYVCRYPTKAQPFIDISALINCLDTANNEFRGKKVATTLIGATPFDGGKTAEEMLPIIEGHTRNLNIDVYAYHQLKYTDEIADIREKTGKSGKELNKILRENFLMK